MNGWLKLWRKVQNNEIFRRDRTAWHVFEVLLINCNLKGEWSGGRIQLGFLCDEKPTTTYHAVLRLKNAKMVTLSSNSRFTRIYICNWQEYQGNGISVSDSPVTAQYQPSDTLIRNKNKNKEYTYTHLKITKEEYEDLKTKFPLKDVKGECDKADDWLANTRKTYKDFAAFMRNWLRKSPDVRPAKKNDGWSSKYAKFLSDKIGNI